MAKSSTPKFVTKKHQARLERERTQRRYLLIGSSIILALVLLVILYGVLDQTVLQPRRPVATVDGEAISLQQFQSRVKFNRIQLINQYQQTYQFAQFFGQDPTTGYFGSTLQSIQSQLTDVSVMGTMVVDQLVNERLIAHEAEKMGITVTDAEVDKRLQEYFSYFPEGTPTAEPTFAAKPTSTLSPTQMALVPPTEIPTEQPTLAVEGTPQATGEAPAEATAEPTAELSPTPEPTATPYTQEGFESTKSEYFTSLGEYNITEEDLRQIFYYDLLRQKVEKQVTADVATEEEQVWARHILVADEATANTVLERLNNGEDFAKLAAEYSTDSSKDQGGDLGWFNRAKMVPEFADAAFSLEVGQISKPVKSQFGYHIIQVLGHEVRPLSETDLQAAKDQAFADWLSGLRETEGRVVTNTDVWTGKVPTEPAFAPQG